MNKKLVNIDELKAGDRIEDFGGSGTVVLVDDTSITVRFDGDDDPSTFTKTWARGFWSDNPCLVAEAA